ncbi:MAG: hypothetical protein HOL04_12420 [Gammaproteobacteria bacterium]|jgi:hypothetical protein|nr:hypothetical protein [Gammaproteobacteria bacterium]MBT4607775.1 hypothetical protein [Thiotrichales bacterium]MBT3967472.1 hypothetical protein [Gammaproteobacteria bacterium]MBT4331200.1 hypothetical protein [Gammaproteobacteria bacterium]MBT5362540.1 hypothetical protein [Gammaproteobacteria bacterium]
MKIYTATALLILPLLLSGCFVGETAALVVQTPFEVADVILPGDAGEAVESAGEGAAWITDAIIPF